MATLAEIKDWFRTGLKPTQTQFWTTWDSFWHKDSPIPQGAVQNLENTLFNKADAARLEEHINDTVAHSGGGSGGRFGIEDTTTSQDRVVNLGGNNLQFQDIGQFNVTGKLLSNVIIPFGGGSVYFSQTNIYTGDPSLDGKSLLNIYGIPMDVNEVEAYFIVDESPLVQVFTQTSTFGNPVWVAPEIQGTIVTPLHINVLLDTSRGTVQLSELRIKGTESVVFEINNESMGLSPNSSNDGYYGDVPEWYGKAVMDVGKMYNYEVSDYPETITARVSVDGVISDMVFTLDVQYSEYWGSTLHRWIRPGISGNDISPIGLLKVESSANVYMALPDTYYEGQKIVVKDTNGTLSYAVLEIPTPNIDTVLSQGPRTRMALSWNSDSGYETNVSDGGVYLSSGQGYYAKFSNQALQFYSYYLHPDHKYAVNLKPDINQGNVEPAEVILPKRSGYLPTKSDIQGLSHKTYTVANSIMTDTEWINLIYFDKNSNGNFRAANTTLIYKGTANATWNIPVESFNDCKYTIINNTNYTITIVRGGITTLWMNGTSNTSITIPAYKWADIIGSEDENRFYFRIN